MARIVALMVVAVLAATPAAATAVAPPEPQSSPFQGAPSQNQVGEQPAPTEAPAPQTEVDDGSVGARETLLIAAAIVALIGGIWFVISRDAKRVTGGRRPETSSSAGGRRSGSGTRSSRRGRRLSAAERKRRKRGSAAK